MKTSPHSTRCSATFATLQRRGFNSFALAKINSFTLMALMICACLAAPPAEAQSVTNACLTVICPPPVVTNYVCSDVFVPQTYPLSVSNNCPNLQVQVNCNPPPGTPLGVGVHSIHCVVTAGGAVLTTCDFRIVVIRDTEPPQIRCPDDITVAGCRTATGLCGTVVNYPAPAAIDNSGSVAVSCSPPSGSFFACGSTVVTCAAFDRCQNRSECVFKVVVNPPEPLSIQCPTAAITAVIPCASNCVPVLYPAPVVANGVLVGCNPPSGSCLPAGIHTVTCSARNICGDTAQCSFDVRVLQTPVEPPVIRCPQDIVVTTCGDCQIVNYPAPVVVNGVLVGCTPPSGTCFPIGSTIVNCIARNDCAGSECKFTVTVRPTPPATIQCPTAPIILTLPCGSNCIPVTYPAPVVSNGTLVGCNPPPGTCLPAGLHTITCRATNDCGGATGCEFNVRIIQGPGEPPAIRCPDDIKVRTCDNCSPVSYPAPVVVNGVLVGCTPPSGTCFPIGSTVVTCLATNQCGRSECSFTITVSREACVKPPLNMVLWLPFDEPAGIIAHNLVAGAPNGVQVNGPVPFLGQHVLNSLCFDGINDLVRVPHYAAIGLSQSDFTIDAWVLPRESTGSRTIVSKVQVPLPGTLTPTRGYEFYLSLGRLNLDLFGAAYQNFDSGVVVPADNAWHHVAVTVRRGGGGNVRFYLDGVGVSSLGGPITAPLGNSTRLQVGHSTQSGPGPMVPFRGYIDEVEIFNRPLAPAEINGLWRADRAGKCKIKCTIPWDVSFAPQQPYVTINALICNSTPLPQPVTWSATGPMPILPPNGSFVIPPFSCTNLPIQVCRPTNGMPVGAVAVWNLTINPAGQCPMTCMGSVINPGPLVTVTVPTDIVQIPGTNHTRTVRIGLNGLPPGVPVRLRAIGPDMEPDQATISLNGLPPGVPWVVPPGLIGGDFGVPVRFVMADPIGTYTILLEADVDGDGSFDTLASFDVENPVVSPPTIVIVHRDERHRLFWQDEGDGFGFLETSKEPDGPWVTIPNAGPGYPVDPSELKQFFRVTVPE